jgi:hypothetical protein
MTKTIQWVTVATALCAAVASQLAALRGLVPEAVLTAVLVITNVVSAVLPSLKGDAK